MTLQPYSLAVVAAVNDDKVLRDNLAASAMIAEGRIPLVVERGYSSASTAYNTGLAHTTADIVLFIHQDVYLPKGWDGCLLETMDELSKKNDNWAVLGVIGRDDAGKFFGRVWSSGLGKQVGTALERPKEVGSIDELLIVLRTNIGLRFDEKLKGYRFYGTDIVRSARKTGFAAYVFDAPVVHNSMPRRQLPKSFWRSYHYMQRKWREDLPIHTPNITVARSKWPLVRNLLWAQKQRLLGQNPSRQRCKDPSALAGKLGYEHTEQEPS